MFQQSDETAALVRYLAQHEKGTMVRYAELSRVAKIKIESTTPRLRTARHILVERHAQVWDCVRPNVGLRRLDDREVAELIKPRFIGGARRKLKRGGSHADVVEVERLDKEEQARFALDCIQRELGLSALSKATATRIGKMARGSSNDLPAFNVVEWAISLTPKGKRATV
jgi:hypothetical protein